MDGCRCVVSTAVWDRLLSMPGEDDEETATYEAALVKYHRFLANSFVDINRNVKWCPEPGCSSAIFASGAVTEASVFSLLFSLWLALRCFCVFLPLSLSPSVLVWS